jgi:transposase-like protein
MSKQTSNKFSPEVRSRAVRLVLDHEHEHPLLVERTFAWISRNLAGLATSSATQLCPRSRRTAGNAVARVCWGPVRQELEAPKFDDRLSVVCGSGH